VAGTPGLGLCGAAGEDPSHAVPRCDLNLYHIKYKWSKPLAISAHTQAKKLFTIGVGKDKMETKTKRRALP
jgi:hypothetical protein